MFLELIEKNKSQDLSPGFASNSSGKFSKFYPVRICLKSRSKFIKFYKLNKFLFKMKKIFFYSIFLLFLFIGFSLKGNADCPTADAGGIWNGPVTDQFTYDNCTIVYTYCYRINLLSGDHEINVNDIRIVDPCNPSLYEANKAAINDSIISYIARGPIVSGPKKCGGWDLHIPPCPDILCLSVYDKICYSGWLYDDAHGEYYMNKCDDLLRACHTYANLCWTIVNGQQVVQVTYFGPPRGPACPQIPMPCNDNCSE